MAIVGQTWGGQRLEMFPLLPPSLSLGDFVCGEHRHTKEQLQSNVMGPVKTGQIQNDTERRTTSTGDRHGVCGE